MLCCAPPPGVQGLSTAIHPIALHCTAQGSALLCITIMHLYAYARKILLRKLFRNVSNFVTEFYLKFHREGGDLHSEILSVKRWKNKRKCQKMVLFSWFSWKMVKYFIEILSYFWPIMLILSQFSGKNSWFWAIFRYFLSILIKNGLFSAIFELFSFNFNKGVVQELIRILIGNWLGFNWISLKFNLNLVFIKLLVNRLHNQFYLNFRDLLVNFILKSNIVHIKSHLINWTHRK